MTGSSQLNTDCGFFLELNLSMERLSITAMAALAMPFGLLVASICSTVFICLCVCGCVCSLMTILSPWLIIGNQLCCPEWQQADVSYLSPEQFAQTSLHVLTGSISISHFWHFKYLWPFDIKIIIKIQYNSTSSQEMHVFSYILLRSLRCLSNEELCEHDEGFTLFSKSPPPPLHLFHQYL